MHWIYIIGFFAIFTAAAIFVQRLLLKRALNQVVAIFNENRATTPETARTLKELNLLPPGFLKKAAAFRDFKYRVVEALVNADIVIITDDQKYYLSNSALAQSPIRQMLDKPH